MIYMGQLRAHNNQNINFNWDDGLFWYANSVIWKKKWAYEGDNTLGIAGLVTTSSTNTIYRRFC